MRCLIVFFVLFFASNAISETLAHRNQAFRQILVKEKTDASKIKKAEQIALDKKSRFRVTAINYLIDHQSRASGSVMVQLMKDRQVSEFAIYGVGEIGFYEATPLLIKYMRDDNRNNRGNAFRALQKLYPREFNFEFHHDDPEYQRNQVVDAVTSWWNSNQAKLRTRAIQQISDADKKDAEERWDKYAKEYLERPQD